MTLDKFAAAVAWPLAAALFIVLGALAVAVFVHRAGRRRKARRSNQARSMCLRALHEIRAGRITYEDGLTRLHTLHTRQLRRALEDLVMANKAPTPEMAALLARVCGDLGLVDAWRAILGGSDAKGGRPSAAGRRPVRFRRPGPLSVVRRAEAAEKLGIIRDRSSCPLLAGALSDPHPAVHSAAARALARISEPRSFPALLEKLEAIILGAGPEISVRGFEMAVASFPAAHAAPLTRLLNHADARVRAIAADVISVMLELQATERREGRGASAGLAPELAAVFVTRLAADPGPEVRARTADVLGHLDSFTALPRILHLADDAEWFVRLHAVRALGRMEITSLAAIVDRLTDRHWRVREAAAQALAARGPRGVKALVEHVMSSDDRYSQEQVAEQIERAGLMPACIQLLAAQGRSMETRFAGRMAEIGHGEILAARVRGGANRPDASHQPAEPADELGGEAEDLAPAGTAARHAG